MQRMGAEPSLKPENCGLLATCSKNHSYLAKGSVCYLRSFTVYRAGEPDPVGRTKTRSE